MRTATGLLALDVCLGAKFSPPNIITIYGGETTFKTGLCLNMARKYQQNYEKNALFFDTGFETSPYSVDKSSAECVIVKSNDCKRILDVIQSQMLDGSAFDLFVIDSITALEMDMGDAKNFMFELYSSVKKSNKTIVITAQTRKVKDNRKGYVEMMSYQKPLMHWSTVIIELLLDNFVQDNNYLVKTVVHKNSHKFFLQPLETKFLVWDCKINDKWDVIQAANDLGIVSNNKSHQLFKEGTQKQIDTLKCSVLDKIKMMV